MNQEKIYPEEINQQVCPVEVYPKVWFVPECHTRIGYKILKEFGQAETCREAIEEKESEAEERLEKEHIQAAEAAQTPPTPAPPSVIW
jgi:hypothetical protein